MKKVLIAGILLSVYSHANGIDSRIIEAYKNGHQQGVNQIEREFDLQGYEESTIIPKQYIVKLNIDNIPQNEILLYKNYAFFEGLLPVTVKTPSENAIIFASYNREVDAQALADGLNQKIPLADYKITVSQKEEGEYVKKPFIYKYLFDKMLKEIKDSVEGKVFFVKEKVSAKTVEKEVEPPKRAQEPKKEKATPKIKPKTELTQKFFVPKYPKVRAFSYEKTWHSYDSKQWDDNNFKFAKFFTKDDKISNYNTITTKNGVEYIKVEDKNLFIEIDYVDEIK